MRIFPNADSRSRLTRALAALGMECPEFGLLAGDGFVVGLIAGCRASGLLGAAAC